MVRKNRSRLNFILKLINKPIFWVLFIGITVFLLRLPTLFEPHRYADEEIYLTLGQAFRKGLVFYRDIHDNKPPFLYLIAALAGTITWFRFILFFWHAVNVLVFWFLAKAILKKNPLWLIGTTTFIFALITTLPIIEGNIANGENFMILPGTLGALLLWCYRNRLKSPAFLIAGILFAIAFLFKVPIVFDLIGISLFLTLGIHKNLKTKLKFFFSPAPWLLLIGFLFPILISVAYYAFKGAAQPYVTAALMQNINYLSSWEQSKAFTITSLWSYGLFQRGVVLLVFTALLLSLQKLLTERTLFVLLWFIFSLYGALLSGRPYPHYFLEPILPFCLMLGLFIKEKINEKFAILLVALLLPISVCFYHVWYYQSLPYYQNFLEFSLGKKTKTEFFGFFDGVNRNYQIAEYIVNHTSPDEKIFVWGTEPAIYSLSNRLPVGRYTVSYHIADFNAWKETMITLNKEKPSFIIKMLNEPKTFSQLNTFLREYYLPVKTINEAVIYHKIY